MLYILCKSLNGYVIRDQKDWERILWDIKIDGGNGYIYVRNDETIGSILLVKDKGELSIRALYSTDILSYKELLFLLLIMILLSTELFGQIEEVSHLFLI